MVEHICKDMETVCRFGDIKNGHMINVLGSKLPAKVAQDWYNHKVKEKVDTRPLITFSGS